jgi:vacuolar-type H+-ATPase subunit E/Vma4
MPLHDLLAAMRAEADAEIAHLERESEREVARITATAEREGQALERELLRQARNEIDAERAGRLAQARLGVRREVRAGREECIRVLLDDVRARLAELRGRDRYRDTLGVLLHEGLIALPSCRRVRVDPRDEALVRELLIELGADLAVRAELRSAGGIELETDDGRRLCNTFEARLEAAEPALRLSFGRIATAVRRAGVSAEAVA